MQSYDAREGSACMIKRERGGETYNGVKKKRFVSSILDN